MRKRLTFGLATAALALAMLPGMATAAQKTGCPSGDWVQWDIYGAEGVAVYFFEHLLPDYGFANPDEFGDAIDAAYDRNGDDQVCAKEGWGYELNPKSHWYRVGLDVLGEPIHVLMVRDNNASGG